MILDEGMMKNNSNLYYSLIFIAFVVVYVDLSSHTLKNVIFTDVSRKTCYFIKLLFT